MSKSLERRGVCIIADDLTGACDAGGAFAQRGAATDILLQPDRGGSIAEVRAVCTATRDAPPAEAGEAIRRAVELAGLDRFEQVFKKVDSVFRGNTMIEIAATIERLPEMFAIVAPAFPARGRTCSERMLHIRDLSGERSLPIGEWMHEAGLRLGWLAQSTRAHALQEEMRAAVRQGLRGVFCEATSESELRAIVGAARALDRRILWIGSAGLAHALAEALYPGIERRGPELPDGVLLAFTGSDHPVSGRQLAHLRERHIVIEWPSTTASRLHAPVAVLHIERGHATEAQIREAVCPFDRRQIGCLLMNGGDTALHVCRALGVRFIRIERELEPGVPVGILRGGGFDGCTVILKSGGFGDAGLLTRIANECVYRKEIPA